MRVVTPTFAPRSMSSLLSEVRHGALDTVQDLVEVFAKVGGEEAEDKVAVFLEEGDLLRYR